MADKLIRGVIYDTDLEEFKEDMLWEMTQRDEKRHQDKINELLDNFQKDAGFSENEAKSYFCGADTISALTRYNVNTGINHNLIIPKEALSVGLVNELEQIDLGKDLIDEYTEYFIRKMDARNVTPEEIVNGDELMSLLEKEEKDKIVKIPKDSPLGKVIGKILGIA